MTRDEFFRTLAPHAIRARLDGSPLFVSVRLAQNLLETGGVIHPWFNLGGIKVGSGKPNEWWDGSSVRKGTWEVINGQRVDTSANFRAYKSVYHFYKDQDLLFNASRYAPVRAAKTPEEQCAALQVSGYATDPAYAGKLIAIMKEYGLKKYDEEAKAHMQMIEELKERVEKLEKQQERVPAPKWFVDQFGSGDLGGLISDPHFTVEGWRALAVALRAQKAQK